MSPHFKWSCESFFCGSHINSVNEVIKTLDIRSGRFALSIIPLLSSFAQYSPGNFSPKIPHSTSVCNYLYGFASSLGHDRAADLLTRNAPWPTVWQVTAAGSMSACHCPELGSAERTILRLLGTVHKMVSSWKAFHLLTYFSGVWLSPIPIRVSKCRQ